MFVPFDNLYEFCDQMVDDDTLIYVFKEAGNRKISNLRQHRSRPGNWWRDRHEIYMIMNDQEPLNFDFYQDLSPDEVKFVLTKNFGRNLMQTRWADEYVAHAAGRNLKFFMDDVTICDRAIICHSEINSKEISKYQALGFVPMYWWSHAVIAKDWYRFAAMDRRLDWKDFDFVKDFNLYNRAWSGTREYRLKMVELLLDAGLCHSCDLKLSKYDSGIHYKDHQYHNPRFSVTQDLDILPDNNSSSCSSASYDPVDYGNSAIDVVLETVFDDTRIHLTEKILRPIACGKPFVLAAGPGALSVLRNYGFQTFHDMIDESYDLETDPLIRLQKIVDLMRSIAELNAVHKKDLYRSMHARAQQNKKHFWSQRFDQTIVEEFQQNYHQAVSECRQHMTGHQWTQMRMMRYQQTRESVRDDQWRTRQDYVRLFREIQKNRSLRQ